MIFLMCFILFMSWNAIGSIIMLIFINSDLFYRFYKKTYMLALICTPINMFSSSFRKDVDDLIMLLEEKNKYINY